MMSLFCKIIGHKVEVSGTNEWQVPTREHCTRCGLSRRMKRIPDTNCFQWLYSDGRQSVGYPSGEMVSDIKFGDVL